MYFGITIKKLKTTIGRKRIISFPQQNATSVRLYVTSAKALPSISEIAGYLIDKNLVEKD